MKVQKPKKLKKGDLIGLIAPASAPEEPFKINSAVKYFESLGYRVETGENINKQLGYLAGSDEERLSDLHLMFKNKEVKAVFCLRGGYGSGRLLDKIDYKLIKNNPKIFVGYSDITALQMALFAKTGLISFAGPMPVIDFAENISSFTEENFWKLLTSNAKPGRVNLPDGENLYKLSKGIAKGKIVGGNLSILTSLAGTPYLPDFKNNILLIEETGEVPYRIDRMLNQLKLANIINKTAGIILGTFTDCNELDPEKITLTLGEVIDHYFCNIDKPVVYNFKHGHIKDNLTVPIGIKVKLNASRQFVEYEESAVSN